MRQKDVLFRIRYWPDNREMPRLDETTTTFVEIAYQGGDVALGPAGFALMLLHLLSRYAVENGCMSVQETKAWFDEQIDLARRGRFFFSLTYYRMSAIKS